MKIINYFFHTYNYISQYAAIWFSISFERGKNTQTDTKMDTGKRFVSVWMLFSLFLSQLTGSFKSKQKKPSTNTTTFQKVNCRITCQFLMRILNLLDVFNLFLYVWKLLCLFLLSLFCTSCLTVYWAFSHVCFCLESQGSWLFFAIFKHITKDISWFLVMWKNRHLILTHIISWL